MVQENEITASQAYGSTVTYAKQRHMGSGTTKARLTDVTITQPNGTGGSYVQTFDYVDYRIGLYKRAGANSILVVSKVIRRHWGVPLGWTTLGSIPSGYYSFQTGVEKLVIGGQTQNNLNHGAWVTATFDAIYPAA